MPISRRGFLGYAAGASAAGLAATAGLPSLFAESPGKRAECVLVVSGSNCTVGESAAGYESALSAANVAHQQVAFQSLVPARTVIVPAAGSIAQVDLRRLREHLDNGSTVLFESGAAFSGSGEFNFHRRLIDKVFGLGLHSPVGLWDSADSFKRSPYVDYRWPLRLKVRDFSKIVPMDDTGGDTIAWFHEFPVAARRRVGKGTLVFLGSPLGPHLLSGDREAHCWLAAFCASC